MLHTTFAERTARRLEAMADRLEEEGQWLKLDTVSARANELRVAAHLVRGEAAAVTEEEVAREKARGMSSRGLGHRWRQGVKVLIARISAWWREAERRERHRRMRLYYERGGERPEEEWLVDPTLPSNSYYIRPF